MMEQITQAAVSLLAAVLTLVTGVVSVKIKSYLQEKGVLAQLESKRKYADIVVHAVQQIYQTADGPQKLNEAKSQLIELLNKNGIPFTDEELQMLIEAAVKGMKTEEVPALIMKEENING